MDYETTKMEHVDSGKKAVLFILPSIVTVLLSSVYGIADALIVAYHFGADALASVITVLPIQHLIAAIGMMFATGAASHISHYIGRKDYENASSHMSTILIFESVVAIALMLMFATIIGLVSHFIGVEGKVLQGAEAYGMAFSLAIPFYLMQSVTSQILIVSGRGKTASLILFAGLMINLIYDMYQTEYTGMGLAGTGYSTAVGTAFSTALCLYLLYFDKKSVLKPRLPSKNLRIMISVCKNGIPQMLNTVSLALSTTLLLMFSTKLTGSETIAARAVSINLQVLLYSLCIGYTQGSTSLTSYFFGKGDRDRVSMMFRTGLVYTAILGAFVFVLLHVLRDPIAQLFMESEYASERVKAYLFSLSYSFVIAGTNLFASSMFVAASDSKHANMISLTKALYVGVPLLCILSLSFGADGLGIASICTDLITLALSTLLIYRYGYSYGFLRKEPFG